MAKVEMTFKTDHADLYRDENGNLIVHLIGVDDDELLASLNKLKADQAALAAGTQAAAN